MVKFWILCRLHKLINTQGRVESTTVETLWEQQHDEDNYTNINSINNYKSSSKISDGKDYAENEIFQV